MGWTNLEQHFCTTCLYPAFPVWGMFWLVMADSKRQNINSRHREELWEGVRGGRFTTRTGKKLFVWSWGEETSTWQMKININEIIQLCARWKLCLSIRPKAEIQSPCHYSGPGGSIERPSAAGQLLAWHYWVNKHFPPEFLGQFLWNIPSIRKHPSMFTKHAHSQIQL